MPFKTPGANSEYIRQILRPETDELLKEMTAYADEKFIPVLLPESAVFLAQMISLSRPKKVLEIGTAIGYSSQIILRNGGILRCCRWQ